MFQYSASGDARGLTRFTPSPDGANRPPTRRTRPRDPVHPVLRRGEPARIEENSALQRGRLGPDPSRPWRQTCLPGFWFLRDLGDGVSSDCLGRGRKRRNRFIDGVCRGGSVAIDGVADDGGPAKRARALRGVIREVHDSVRKVGEGAEAVELTASGMTASASTTRGQSTKSAATEARRTRFWSNLWALKGTSGATGGWTAPRVRSRPRS